MFNNVKFLSSKKKNNNNFFTKFKTSFGGSLQKFNVSLQRLGKALLFPIAVLPIAALMNRIGTLLSDPTIGIQQYSAIWWIGQFIMAPGAAVFNNIAIIFGIGVAFGFAKDYRGEAALCGGISYLILSMLTSENFIASLFYQNVLTFNGTVSQTDFHHKTFSSLLYIPINFIIPGKSYSVTTGQYVLDTGVVGGIACGAMTAYFYNRFKDIQLPKALGFFGGRRFIPMITVVATFFLSFIFAALWPWVQYVLIQLGETISKNNANAAIGAGIYGFVNRLLQPFGAHHIINTFLWFQLPVKGTLLPGSIAPTNAIPEGHNQYLIFGDINAFNAGLIGSGIFQSGFFPLFFGGIPATGLAMIFCAEKSKRREVAVFLSGVAGVAFLTGIDEPIVFIWIFLSPLLLIIHAILTGLFAALVVGMGIRVGFGFSAGLIDYVISMPKSWEMALQGHSTHLGQILANPLWILPISVVMGAVYFPIWTFVIKKMNVQTPGRSETDDISSQTDVTKAQFTKKQVVNMTSSEKISKIDNKNNKLSKKELQSQKYDMMATKIVELVGKDNFKIIENCATRLRLVVKDNKLPIDNQLKNIGIFQVIRIGNEGLQLVVGTDVEHVTNRVRNIVGL